MKSMSFHTAALLADSINDASSTRKVYLLAAGLAVLGITLIVMTVWFWRSTRHDPELLAPLEVMGARRFRRLDGGSQQQVLDRSRPADAKPMRWGVVRGEASGEPEVDLTEILRNSPAGFDDLRDPSLIAVAMQEIDDDASGEVPTVAPTFVPDKSVAAVDPLADIDSLLAAAGAKLDGVPPVAAVAPSRDASRDADAAGVRAATVPATSTDAAEDASEDRAERAADTAPPDLVGAEAAAARTVVDEPAPAGERVAPRGSKPGVKPTAGAADAAPSPVEAPPLVIVPVDHELRPSTPRRATPEPQPEPVAVDATTAAVVPDEDDEPVSIDPLLRMFNRHDS